MRRGAVGMLALACAAIAALGAGAFQAEKRAPMRFVAVEVRLDPHGSPLAGYQVEVKAAGAKLVGIEGAGEGAFARPPHYDPAALHAQPGSERVVLAALGENGPLPQNEVVVAMLHYAVETSGPLNPRCTLVAAGDPTGARLTADCRVLAVEDSDEGVEP